MWGGEAPGGGLPLAVGGAQGGGKTFPLRPVIGAASASRRRRTGHCTAWADHEVGPLPRFHAKKGRSQCGQGRRRSAVMAAAGTSPAVCDERK